MSKQVTHLVLPEAKGPKYDMALKYGVCVVESRWLVSGFKLLVLSCMF